MKAAIAVDDWKLPVFRKRLVEAGFEYTDAGAIIGETTILHVQFETSTFGKLTAVVRAAQSECAKAGRPGK